MSILSNVLNQSITLIPQFISNIMVIDHQLSVIYTGLFYVFWACVQITYLTYIKRTSIFKKLESIGNGSARFLYFIDGLVGLCQSLYLSFVLVSVFLLLYNNDVGYIYSSIAFINLILMYLLATLKFNINYGMPLLYFGGILLSNFIEVPYNPVSFSLLTLRFDALMAFSFRLGHMLMQSPFMLERSKDENIDLIISHTILACLTNYSAYLIYAYINYIYPNKYDLFNLFIEVVGLSQIIVNKYVLRDDEKWIEPNKRTSLIYKIAVSSLIFLSFVLAFLKTDMLYLILNAINKSSYIRLLYILQFIHLPIMFGFLLRKLINIIVNKNFSEQVQLILLGVSSIGLFVIFVEDFVHIFSN